MTKRAYFLFSSIILTVGFFLLSLVPFQWKYTGIGGFSLGVALYHIVLFYSMVKTKRNLFVSAFLPAFFGLSVSLFRFLFAVNWVWQVVLILVFLFGIYTLFLMENVFLISKEVKTVPLYRAASTIGFLMTLIVAFFIYEVVFSFRLMAWQNGLLVSSVSLPLLIHFFWSTRLSLPLEWNSLAPSFIFSLILGEISVAISFWPLGTTKASLYLVSMLYVFLGLAQAFCQEKLFKETIREFIWIGLGTFLALFLVTSWR